MPASEPLRIQLLGGFRVSVGLCEIDPSAWRLRTASTLVKLLALAPTHSLHREHLMDTMWPDAAPTTVANNFRYSLYTARRTLGSASVSGVSYLQRNGTQIVLGPPGTVCTDVEAFTNAIQQAWRSDDPDLHRHAIDLYRGDLLPEDRYEEWAENHRIALLANYVTTLRRLAELYERQREPDHAIEILQRLLLVQPADEAAHSALMRLYSRAGRRTEALAQYDQLTAMLEREFNTGPDEATLALAQEIRNQVSSAAGPASGMIAGPNLAQSNLPDRLSTMIGREREITEVKHLLTTKRLVTLTGPGGIGKSRLGEAIARDLIVCYQDGVHAVWLAGIRDPKLVIPTIAQTLGVSERDGQSLFESLITYLRPRSLLLLLDNVEHVIEAAPAVSSLLTRCPHVVVLATSRVRLRVQGEQQFPVGPMNLPDTSSVSSAAHLSQFDAVTLFSERAREITPGFRITDENAASVAAICRRLEGLPLAIELAAARVDMHAPDELLARLDVRLPMLEDGPSDLLVRQHSMRNTIAWSYDLLQPREQFLFRRLSVFAGGWTVDAAESIDGCPESNDDEYSVISRLRTLVDHNLIQRTERPDGTTRFSMLETIREYGLEQLMCVDHDDKTFQRHAEYYLALTQGAEAMLHTTDSATYVRRLDEESDNVQAVLTREEGQVTSDTVLLLGAALWRFWLRRNQLSEGRRLLETILSRADGASIRAKAAALHALARLICETGEYAKATAPAIDSLRLSRSEGNKPGVASALMILGYIDTQLQQYDRAIIRLEEALAIDREIGRDIGVIEDLNTLALVAYHEARHNDAEAYYTEIVRMRRARGDKFALSNALNNLGTQAWIQGDLPRASTLLEESLALSLQLQHTAVAAIRLVNLGHVALDQGNFPLAAARYRDALRLDDSEKASMLVEVLEGFASVVAALKQPLAAARLFGAADAFRTMMGMPIPPPERLRYERHVASARVQTTDAAWTRAWDEGRATPVAVIVEEILKI